MRFTTVSQSGDLPVPLDDFKAHARETTPYQDDVLLGFIETATDHCEQLLGRFLRPTTLLVTLDAFPTEIGLPRSPATSIAWIKYIDPDGIEQTLATTVYRLDASNELRSRIVLKFGQAWPATRSEVGCVTVQYVTSVVATSAIKGWIKMAAARLNENREASAEQVLHDHAFVDRLLDRDSVPDW